MKILIIVHPNMALTDNWTHAYDQGVSYYRDVLAARADYDVVVCPFLPPFCNLWQKEHDVFVAEASRLFDVAEFELRIGEVILAHLDAIFLENEVTHVDFAGGYATDCLARTLNVFLSNYGSYCRDSGICVLLRSDLIYDSWSHARLSERQTDAAFHEMIYLSGALHYPDLINILGA